MIRLGVSNGPERRSAGYTSLITQAIESAAAGGASLAAATAAVEACSSWWGRVLALASVAPVNRRTQCLTPAFLEMAGRELGRTGQLVCDIDVSGGVVRLHPAAQSYVTVGSVDPQTWVYVSTFYGASDTRVRYLRYDGVVHLRYGVSPVRPWSGRAPWMSAGMSGELLAGVERQLSGESRSASGYILPVADTGDRGQEEDDDGEDDPLTAMRRDLAAAGGKTVLAPTQMSGGGMGPSAAPSHDWTPRRFGIAPQPAVIELRRDVERSIISAYGLPPVLMDKAAAAGSLREGWRMALALTVAPVVELVQDELRRALGVPTLTLDMRRARAADTVMLSRALHSLQQAGVPLDTARDMVGL